MKIKMIKIFTILLMIIATVACDQSGTSNKGDTPPKDEQKAIELVKEGTTALDNKQYDDALLLFANARSYDNENINAALYWSFLNMASVSVDPAVVKLAENAGFEDYPQTMDDFIQMDWLDEMPVAIDKDSNRKDNIQTLLFPKITIPTGYDQINLFNLIDTNTGNSLESTGMLDMSEYFTAIIYHLQENYPDGFNSPVTSVVNLITSKLNDTISALENISNNDSISLSPNLFIDGNYDPFSGLWPEENGTLVPIVIGKSEVLLSVSSLQIINSLLNSVLAVDMSLSLSDFYKALNPIDGAFWGIENMNTQTGLDWSDLLYSDLEFGKLPQYPMSKGFLQTTNKSVTVLAKSKLYMTNALTNMSDAIDGIAERSGPSSAFTLSKANHASGFWPEVLDVTGVSSVFLNKLSTSLANNSSIAIPTEIFTDLNSNLSADFTDSTNWPTVEDWTNVNAMDDIPNAVEVNLSVLFERPMLALDNLLELNTNSEPVIYKNDGSDNFSVVTSYDYNTLKTDIDDGNEYAVKVNDVTFGGLFSIPATKMELYTNESPFDVTQKVTSGAISYFVSLISPKEVFSSLNNAGKESITETSSEYYIKATGSFWYTAAEVLKTY